MPYMQLPQFKRGFDALVTLAGPASVRVLSRQTSLIFRCNTYRMATAVTIPTCHPNGVSFTAAERQVDEEGGNADELMGIGLLTEVAGLIRAIRAPAMPTVVELGFDDESRPCINVLHHRTPMRQVLIPYRHFGEPSYMASREADFRYETDTLTKLATAGRKISPGGTWSQTGGTWEIKNSQGLALRVATTSPSTQ